MRYIGPFFRMNSLSQKDIEGQLFFLSREAIKTIVLSSKCGILSSFRPSKKSSHTNNINTLSNFSPLICIYRKASPVFIHNKTSHGFDESSFKKDINPATNALMTLSLLELSDYYSHYKDKVRNVNSLEEPYSYLIKEQLEFYSENLRNSEGVFVEKNNLSDSNSKGYNLIEKDKKFNFSDQAIMMNAYYLYSKNNPEDSVSIEYKNFSLQILDMFLDFNDAMYNVSFEEGCKLLLSFNLFYSYSTEEKCKSLIIDLSDFLINKIDEKNYYSESLDDCSILALTLLDSFKHTEIISFKEKSDEIYDKLQDLYDDEKAMFLKPTDKKEIKYSSLEISFYFLAFLLHAKEKDNASQYKNMLHSLYKKFFISSGLVCSWPEAPSLDEVERYRGLSLQSKDMLDESFFRMPNLPSPASSGMAPILAKSLLYSKKKDSFTRNSDTFDSGKNMFVYFAFIHFLMDDVIEDMDFNLALNNQDIASVDNITENISSSKDISDTPEDFE
ncbi:MAG TPA: hypothetical protein VIK26_04875 [Clostridium sp.]